jgi:hypothetical protein
VLERNLDLKRLPTEPPLAVMEIVRIQDEGVFTALLAETPHRYITDNINLKSCIIRAP